MGLFSGFDISSLINQAVKAASMAALGPVGGMIQSQLFSAIGSEILESAIQTVGEQLGFPQSVIDLAQSAALSAIGDQMGSIENAQEAFQSLLNELSPFDQANLNREISDAAGSTADLWLNTINQANDTQENTDKVSGSKSKDKNFFMVIAEALGEMLGEKAANMMDSLEGLQNAGNDGSDREKAKDFGIAQSKFSADSQMYSMASQLVNSSLKAIGESMSTLARKQ